MEHMPCLMDKVVSTSNGGLSLDTSLSCPLSTNQECIKPQASECVSAIMPSAQTSTNKKDGKHPCSPSPCPEADDNSSEWQEVTHKHKNPCHAEPLASMTLPAQSMTAPTMQVTPAPAAQMVPTSIMALPIPAPNTAPAPLPPNSSSYTGAVAMPAAPGTRNSFPPDLEVTPVPQGGFPIPQIGTTVWRNMNQAIRVSWTVKQGPKVWVHLWRAKYEEDHHPNLAKIRSLIGKIPCPEIAVAARVSTLVAADNLPEKLPPPWHFLVSSIPQDLADFLGQVIVSTPEATCFFLPFDLPLQTYICTLENFTLSATAEANVIVADLVKSTLLNDQETISFIEEHMKRPIPGTA